MLVAHIHESVNGIVGILLNRIVHRVARNAVARTIIVHAQTAANIHKIEVKSHGSELHIELRSLAKRILDAANLRDLATDMEVNQLQAVGHLMVLQEVEGFEKFAGVQSEFATVATAFLPFAATRR